MTRFKIARNNAEEKKQLLQAKLNTSLVQDINLMCEWSGNEKSYVIGELLRYALSMESDFQEYKKSVTHKETAGVAGNTTREWLPDVATSIPHEDLSHYV